MSCSSNLNRLVGSCISTFVSRTKSLVADVEPDLAALREGRRCSVEGAGRSLRSTMGLQRERVVNRGSRRYAASRKAMGTSPSGRRPPNGDRLWWKPDTVGPLPWQGAAPPRDVRPLLNRESILCSPCSLCGSSIRGCDGSFSGWCAKRAEANGRPPSRGCATSRPPEKPRPSGCRPMRRRRRAPWHRRFNYDRRRPSRIHRIGPSSAIVNTYAEAP